jgi:hypothetical protein
MQTLFLSMKIAVNTRFLLKNKLEGIGWFIHEVSQRLAIQHPEHEFIFFFDRHITQALYSPPISHQLYYFLKQDTHFSLFGGSSGQ